MRRALKLAAVGLVLGTATACPRQAVIESEPSRFDAPGPAAIDIAGTYDFVVDLPEGDVAGRMNVTPVADGWAVDLSTNMGEVTASNVRRVGNRLTYDVHWPGGQGVVELDWENRRDVSGLVYVEGSAHDFTATRRP